MSKETRSTPLESILVRLTALGTALSAALYFLFDNWGMLEPILMSPTGGIMAIISSFLGGATGYHICVYAPLVTRFQKLEVKFDIERAARLEETAELGMLRGRIKALEEMNVLGQRE